MNIPFGLFTRAFVRIPLWRVMGAVLLWAGATVSAHAQMQSLFTTQSPALPSVADGVPYELGMKFRLARAGSITAIRYWKSANEGGTHTGNIWSATGTLLASVTFSGESTSGWQMQQLPTALTVQGNTTYVVSVNINSYYAVTAGGLAASIVNGDISSVADGANGTYGSPNAFPTNSYQNSNYFRDIVFVAGQAGAPAKLALTPASASTQPNSAVTYTATIQDANGNTVTNATNAVTFSVSGVSGSFNPASPVTPTNGVATSNFTPTTTGTATITASSAGLTSATATLTVSSGGQPQSLFTTQTPGLPNVAGGPYELGMKFQVARAGSITAIRYFRSANETGTHTTRIWSATGTLLASVPFTGESASGWQTQQLSSALAIQANTTYVVSVNANVYYAVTDSGLAASIVNGDISSVADGNNGVYGNAGTFPTFSYQNGNYFRDIVFVVGP